MTTSPRTSVHAPAVRVPLRIRLRDSFSGGHTEGVWWPQSRDLHVEEADLVDHFPDQAGHVDRLLFSRPDWDSPVVNGRGVRRIHARGGPVRVGSFPSDDTQLMILLMASGRRVSLKVIGSATDPLDAVQQLRALEDGDSSGDTIEAAHDRWDTEDPYS
jgi:hypothetical protein